GPAGGAAAGAVDVAGVASAGHEQAPGRLAPRAAREDAGVGEPARRPAVVVVAVMRARARRDAAISEPHLVALPVVLVEADLARHVAQARAVLVVEPVLDVDVAGAPVRAVVVRVIGPGAAVDDVGERDGGLAGVRAPHGAVIRAVPAPGSAAGAEGDRQPGSPRPKGGLGNVRPNLR